MKFTALLRALLPLALSAPCLFGQACPPAWNVGQFRIGGPNGRVNAAVVHDDGTGPALYVGGNFTTAGGATSPNLARFRAGAWETVAGGVNGEVTALVVHDDGFGPKLYAGGSFTTAGGIGAFGVARWDGVGFSTLVAGAGPTGGVRALASGNLGAGPRLFVGGDFLSVGTMAASRVAAFDGVSWSALGTGIGGVGSVAVTSLAVFTPSTGPAELVAGGQFTIAGGVAVSNVARWSGAAWSAAGAGVNASVLALLSVPAPVGPGVFATGSFTLAGGSPAARIARWNGSTWTPLGAGLSGGNGASLAHYVDAIGPRLVVGGTFTTAGGAAHARVAAYDGVAWSGLGGGASCASCAAGSTVSALASDGVGAGASLYAGGSIDRAGGAPVTNVARFDGAVWSAVGTSTGPDGAVHALSTFDDGTGTALYAAGGFGSAGGAASGRIARWSGATWSPLGTGADGTIRALTTHDAGGGVALYAAGAFSNVDGVAAARVASWNGSTWSALGSGVGTPADNVFALISFDDGTGPALYAGGSFATAGGAPASNVARFSAGAWSALGLGPTAIGGATRAFTTFDDGTGPALYAGGDFGVRKWSGGAWVVVGNGVNGVCRALTVHNDGTGAALYAGGSFDVVGAVPGATVKKLGGGVWSAVGLALVGGTTPGVHCLRSFDDGTGTKLFAGGQFTGAGALQIGRAARFVAGSWQSMQLGADLPNSSAKGVFAFAPFVDTIGSALYVGGDFDFMNGVPSANLCRWASSVGYPGFSTQPPAVVVVPEGGTAVATAVATGGQPMTYQWYLDGLPVTGATTPTLTITNATFANDGRYILFATNSCGVQSSNYVRVSVVSATLSWFNPGGHGGAGYVVTTAPVRPSTGFFVVVSLSSLNGSNPGGGPLLGMWINNIDVYVQFSSQSLPFVGTTDAFGAATWSSGPGGVPLQLGYTLYGMVFVYDQFTATPLGRSLMSSYLLQ